MLLRLPEETLLPATPQGLCVAQGSRAKTGSRWAVGGLWIGAVSEGCSCTCVRGLCGQAVRHSWVALLGRKVVRRCSPRAASFFVCIGALCLHLHPSCESGVESGTGGYG